MEPFTKIFIGKKASTTIEKSSILDVPLDFQYVPISSFLGTSKILLGKEVSRRKFHEEG